MKYQLAGEDEHTFHIKGPDGKTFPIAKHAVGPGVHKRIKELEPVKMADGGEVPDETGDAPAFEQTYEEQSPQPNPEPNRMPGQEGNSLIIEPAESAAPQAPIATEAPQTQSAPSAPNIGLPIDDYTRAFAQKEGGIKQMAGAQAQAAKDQAQAYQEQSDQIAKEQARYEQAHADLDAEHKQLMAAVSKDKIDPNRLYGNMSTGNKILAAISVAIGGIGSGLTGQPNAALGVIQKSIDRDIDAQKMELGKKQTLLSENLRRFGDLNTATQMTRLQINAITQAKVAQAAARSGSAQAQGQAKMLLSDLALEGANIKRQVTMFKVLQDLNKGEGSPEAAISYLRMTNPQQAKEIEGRYVPKVGIASIPVPDKVREEIVSRQGLQESVRQLRDWSQKHSGSLDASEINYGHALAKAVQDQYRRANGQGVFREAEAEFVKGIAADNPTAFLNKYRIDPKYKALEDNNLMQLNNVKRSYGLPEQQAIQYKTVNGVKYMRGPNGQAIAVK